MKTNKYRLIWVPLLYLLMGVVPIFFSSCQKTEEINPQHFPDAESYDLITDHLAMAVSRAMVASTDIRRIIKHEAMRRLDGDYDVLLSQISDRKLSEYNILLKKSASDVLIKDFLADFYEGQTDKKSSRTVIDDIIRNYPELQISVPVECENWDTETVPPVAFLQSDFYEGKTDHVKAYTSNGTAIIDAKTAPQYPVVVVSLNERTDRIPKVPILTPGTPETPSNLRAMITESGIRLHWDMLKTCNSGNTSGYYIYRKGSSNVSYEKIGTIAGYYNQSFDDNNIEAAKTYSYFAMSYFGDISSGPSNYVSQTAPLRPKPVLSFDAIQHTNKITELRWDNDYSQSFNSTDISRFRLGIDNDYMPWKSFGPSQHYCFDNDIVQGTKYIYKINHNSELGNSNAKYDFCQVPYRDISKPSPVYIHMLDFKDWKLESWINGAPEFYVSVLNVNVTTGKTYTIQEKINLEFPYRFDRQYFPDTKVFNWMPGVWFDMITFNVIEYDAFRFKHDIKISAGFNSKDAGKQNLLPIQLGSSCGITIGNGSSNCGNAFVQYFDQPVAYITFPNYGVRLLISDREFVETMQYLNKQ